jgi:aspartate 4-decarboxylase
MDGSKKAKHATREEEQRLAQMSPFELKDKLITIADESIKAAAKKLLNAGRGNPNWISTAPREAFFLLGKFGLEECRRILNMPEVGIAGIPEHAGSASRFLAFLKKNNSDPGAPLLRDLFNYCLFEHACDPDSLVHEWSEGVIGDQYPVPDRMLRHAEVIVQDYLRQELCDGQSNLGTFDLFATEGGTAAMCYLFDSLQANFLLNAGDHIALMTPVFTPYIEIPKLERYKFKVTQIDADEMQEDGHHSWQCSDAELQKLSDPTLKALCVINPSNPASFMLCQRVVDYIIYVVKNVNPNLIIISDDVYGTFIDGFRSLICTVPENTLCVYSFSKYFGCTGWRLATIVLNENNILDRMLINLSPEAKAIVNRRYASISITPEKIKFIDRICADSRQVALNHTAGLSLPQQIQMTLFAGYAILDKANAYKKAICAIIRERYDTLWKSAGLEMKNDPCCAAYYAELDFLVIGKIFHGEEFVNYLKEHYEPVDIVFRLAEETSLVLLNGGGFLGPKWSVRASLANLNAEDYVKIGKGIKTILNQYAEAWKESRLPKRAASFD